MNLREKVRFWLGEFSEVFTDEEVDELIEHVRDPDTFEVNPRRAAAIGYLRLSGRNREKLAAVQLGDARETYTPDYFLRYAAWLYSGASKCAPRRDEALIEVEEDEI